MQNKFLIKEIIAHILARFGCGETIFGKGLTASELLTKKVIKIKYEENEQEIEHSVYCGQDTVGDIKIQGILANLSLDGEKPEYACVFYPKNAAKYGLRLSFNDDDYGIFKIYDEKASGWLPVPLGQQALILSGLEEAISYGLSWNANNDEGAAVETLYPALVKLIESE